MNDDFPMHEQTDELLVKLRRMVRTDAEVEAYLRAKQAERRVQIDKVLLACGFPKRSVRQAGFEGERWIANFDRIRLTLMQDGVVWVIVGTRGAGKTTLCTALARDVIEHGKSARFVDLDTVLSAMRTCAEEALKRFDRPQFLVIDEVFKAAGSTDYKADLLASVLRRRFDNGLDTAMTSNGTLKATARRLGATVTDRMATGGFVEANWPSFRAKLGGLNG